ncbi:MAG: class I SAM-dependent methyltransferase [Bacteroidales bacterium]|nr:class I SAM-dependent methyltransferase [Bacteroidales bacterium]
MVNDLALQRNKYKHLSDAEWHWFLQQIEGRERTADKLPTFASIPDWWYPVRLSCEQCSSELTARYKASLLSPLALGEGKEERFLDLTGGYGVDTYFLSEQFSHTDYVEQNEELCRIAAHNFALSQKSKVKRQKLSIAIHNTTAEDFLLSSPCGEAGWGLIFLDPARRDSHGSKVFRIEDCTPNVVELLPTLLAHSKRLLIKLSPMLDLTQAVTSLSQVNWDIHIVAIKNEVKEVLLLSGGTGQIITIDLAQKDQAFVFTREEEQHCGLDIRDGKLANYLYEPNAAILKAGAYKLVAQRFGLHKLDVNTHLYTSLQFIENFPGRVWRITEKQNLKQANVLTRNYPLTPEQLKKKLHLRDGGTAFVIGCRVAGKPTLLYAERVYSTSM